MVQLTRLLFITALLTLPAAAAAAPGDGIARACVAAFEQSIRKQGRPIRFREMRLRFCGCIEQRVKADGQIGDPAKDGIRQIFIHYVSDRQRARQIRDSLGKAANDRMRAIAIACQQAFRKKPGPAPGKGDRPATPPASE